MRQALHAANLCMVRLRWNRYIRHLIVKHALPHRVEWAPPVEAIALWYGDIKWWTCLAPEGMYWEGTGTSRVVITLTDDAEPVARDARLTLLYMD